MTDVRIIGDCHGHIAKRDENKDFRNYLDLTKVCKSSIQVGDMGFDLFKLQNCKVDSSRHVFLGGNHDNYDQYYQVEHSLGDFGMVEHGGLLFFFLRGAFSIDYKSRWRHNRSQPHNPIWWPEEQLPMSRLFEAEKMYQLNKPDCVITHTCPQEVAQLISRPEVLRRYGYDPKKFDTPTQLALQSMFEYHKPKHWFFGHFHKHLQKEIRGTMFMCADILCHYDLHVENGKIVEVVDNCCFSC